MILFISCKWKPKKKEEKLLNHTPYMMNPLYIFQISVYITFCKKMFIFDEKIFLSYVVNNKNFENILLFIRMKKLSLTSIFLESFWKEKIKKKHFRYWICTLFKFKINNSYDNYKYFWDINKKNKNNVSESKKKTMIKSLLDSLSQQNNFLISFGNLFF